MCPRYNNDVICYDCQIMSLPYELMVKIMCYLPCYDILKRVPLVSKKFKNISEDHYVIKIIAFDFKILADTYKFPIPHPVKWSEGRRKNTTMTFKK